MHEDQGCVWRRFIFEGPVGARYPRRDFFLPVFSRDRVPNAADARYAILRVPSFPSSTPRFPTLVYFALKRNCVTFVHAFLILFAFADDLFRAAIAPEFSAPNPWGGMQFVRPSRLPDSLKLELRLCVIRNSRLVIICRCGPFTLSAIRGSFDLVSKKPLRRRIANGEHTAGFKSTPMPRIGRRTNYRRVAWPVAVSFFSVSAIDSFNGSPKLNGPPDRRFIGIDDTSPARGCGISDFQRGAL